MTEPRAGATGEPASDPTDPRPRADTTSRAGATSAWRREPLRVRLVVLFVALLLIAIGALSTLALTMLRSTLLTAVDEQLDKAAQSLVWESINAQTANNPLIPAEYAVIIADVDGNVVHRYSTAATYPRLGSLDLDAVVARGSDPFTVRSQDGTGTWRVTVRTAEGQSGTVEGTAAIALPLDTVNATVRWMGGALMAVGGGVLLAAAALTYGVVRQSLRPLRRIETTAAQIADGDLSQRVEELPPSTEVGSLARSLNTMLADLEAAFEARRAGEERLQRFVGDASHELRTPLAAIRGYTELYRLGGVPTENVPEVLGRIEESAGRMSALVADLLALTRLDQSAPLAPEAVAVGALLDSLALDARALDPAREVTVDVTGRPTTSGAPDDETGRDGGPDAGVVPSTDAGPGAELALRADPGVLRQILTNLVGNAVAYTPSGSPIELVATTEDPDVVVIDVRDHGPGIPADDRERVFERFARLDAGRSRDEGGSGLGLAIARDAARVLGGDVVCVETPGGGATMRVTLPRA
ncbi:two-component system OmpR family sensor kinase [Salana multivorans]|uniref:histidine kinase n=1 Tax=Salana multivorans TaxID=120377 RepID=A0A3N2D916_9MICO|nr:HAMP domain-containing sensor histidine kinase [Salana multivorans]MBN8881988.1 HAMP domain-containing histidine kinase [Salana multivorans]ROR95954.1 two-component system OmpR family sensor kinase [Salana multivorans]